MRDAINNALKESMKARDSARSGTLRLINAALKDRDIEARGKGREAASEDEILATLSKMVKQREESAKVYEENGRPELAEKERAEIAVIRAFQPKQMDEAETRAAVQSIIAETGAAGPKDMGKVMGALKERYAGQMNFGQVNGIVKDLLAQAAG
ncbi:hypothetical protein SAMN05216548_104256 [Faunimonas pinastri]|uniref:GatB/YqeY domain-containing protein n=1 Tax=Faunimonas pinastri TaxID=1855383 RepID=A0A1H9FZA2_9HYPH|nr:GatB/YqeY domain-containing protein [Faunimonas pinastri]SEQ43161.1 hypothetical protein SAMN05216548_104256 [Faunimonas pinastri]